MLSAATEHNDNEMAGAGAEIEPGEANDAENGNGNEHEDESTENPEQVRLEYDSIQMRWYSNKIYEKYVWVQLLHMHLHLANK